MLGDGPAHGAERHKLLCCYRARRYGRHAGWGRWAGYLSALRLPGYTGCRGAALLLQVAHHILFADPPALTGPLDLAQIEIVLGCQTGDDRRDREGIGAALPGGLVCGGGIGAALPGGLVCG